MLLHLFYIPRQAPDYGKFSFLAKPLHASAGRPLDLLSLIPSTPRLLLLEGRELVDRGSLSAASNCCFLNAASLSKCGGDGVTIDPDRIHWMPYINSL